MTRSTLTFNRLVYVGLLPLLATLGWPTISQATFIPTTPPLQNDVPRPAEQNAEGFLHKWSWNLSNTGVNPALVEGPNWSVRLRSGGEGNSRTLALDAAHRPPPPHVNNDIPRNPPGGAGDFLPLLPAFQLEGLGRPAGGLTSVGKAKAVQFTHPALAGGKNHFDVLSLSAFIPVAPGLAEVVARGRHESLKLTTWSYVPFANGTIGVDASYAGNPATRNVVTGLPVSPANANDGRVQGALKPPNETRDPTDYTVRFESGNPATEMTLAFPGEVDGVPGRLFLSLGFDLFGGQIVVPMLVDAAQVDPVDLFVGVDLSEWLSFPTGFNAFDEFNIMNGESNELAGYLFSTSPLMTDSNGGFLTDNPFTGTVFVAGTVDGGTVPEPATLVLLASSGLAGLAALARRRQPARPLARRRSRAG